MAREIKNIIYFLLNITVFIIVVYCLCYFCATIDYIFLPDYIENEYLYKDPFIKDSSSVNYSLLYFIDIGLNHQLLFTYHAGDPAYMALGGENTIPPLLKRHPSFGFLFFYPRPELEGVFVESLRQLGQNP